MPDGWRAFSVSWSGTRQEGPPAPPWSENHIHLDLCPGCQAHVTLAECVTKQQHQAASQRRIRPVPPDAAP
jgi:hypothetical protein